MQALKDEEPIKIARTETPR